MPFDGGKLASMTRACKELIDSTRSGTYHLITRCVRRERLLDLGERKVWLCRGLGNWLSYMGIDLLAYAVMGNHLHLVIRLRPDVVAGWSEAEVARHALAILPVRSGPGLEPLRVTPAVLERYASNASWVLQQRGRLCSPSWLFRLVKQEIARRANAEDGCTGHFWESRFTSVALLGSLRVATLTCRVTVGKVATLKDPGVRGRSPCSKSQLAGRCPKSALGWSGAPLDMAATLACMVYVDLNPFRAHLVKDPTESLYASIRHRRARMQGVRSVCVRRPHLAPA
jgi:hypothetical protein